MPLTILLLGASGYVGGGIWAGLAGRHRVTGTFAVREVPGFERLDLQDERALAGMAGRGFDLVVHAAGLVDLEAAEADPALAWRLNVRSVELLLQALRGTRTRLVYLSTDNVFDGTREAYIEADMPAPLGVYGRTKLAAEERVLKAGQLVVRIPIVYGRSPFADRFLARFAGPVTRAQTDIVCAPLHLPSLAAALEQLWHRQGLLHLGGAEVMTRLELMRRIRDALRLPTEIVPVRNAELPSGRLRPPRLVLRSLHHALQGPDLDTALADRAAWAAAGASEAR